MDLEQKIKDIIDNSYPLPYEKYEDLTMYHMIKSLIQAEKAQVLEGFTDDLLFDIRESLGIYAGGVVGVETAEKYRELEGFVLKELERQKQELEKV